MSAAKHMIDMYQTKLEAINHLIKIETDPKKIEELNSKRIFYEIQVEDEKENLKKDEELHQKQLERVGKVTALGTFEVNSKKLRITDPCYSKDTWCAGTLDNPMPGKWHAFIQYRNEGTWGVRNSTLFAVHESYAEMHKLVLRGYLYQNHLANLSKINVGVDSGQAGIFDEDSYPEDPAPNDNSYRDDPKAFYNRCGIQTIGDGKNRLWNEGPNRVDALQAGVVTEGCVSLSGDGDGSYRCFFDKNADGFIDAVEISFYYHDGEEELEDDDELPEDNENDE